MPGEEGRTPVRRPSNISLVIPRYGVIITGLEKYRNTTDVMIEIWQLIFGEYLFEHVYKYQLYNHFQTLTVELILLYVYLRLSQRL